GRGPDRTLPIIVTGALGSRLFPGAPQGLFPARVQDASGTYYWHIPTGTTQWEPPTDLGQVEGGHGPDRDSQGNTPTEEQQVRILWRPPPWGDVSRAGLLGPGSGVGPGFPVRSLGWVEMSEEELAPGKSSAAVNSCIRQLAGRGAPPPGGWDQGRAMLLLLDHETLRLLEPVERTLLHAQPVASIRVWGVGRDDGR
uniref:PID domain-containing protein n=1 Tax=Gopherus agassizii TaxID=38772 RepID=A0A452HR29_9SAUR